MRNDFELTWKPVQPGSAAHSEAQVLKSTSALLSAWSRIRIRFQLEQPPSPTQTGAAAVACACKHTVQVNLLLPQGARTGGGSNSTGRPCIPQRGTPLFSICALICGRRARGCRGDNGGAATNSTATAVVTTQRNVILSSAI